MNQELLAEEWVAWNPQFWLRANVSVMDGAQMAAEVVEVSHGWLPEHDGLTEVTVRLSLPVGATLEVAGAALRSVVQQVLWRAGLESGLVGDPPVLRVTRREREAGLGELVVPLVWPDSLPKVGEAAIKVTRTELWQVLGADDPVAVLSAMSSRVRQGYARTWQELFAERCRKLDVCGGDGLEYEAMAWALLGRHKLKFLGQAELEDNARTNLSEEVLAALLE